MNKIITVIGARPQFVKAAVVSKQLVVKDIEEIVIHTGQHFDTNMSKIFFDELGIANPKYNLAVNGGNHGMMTGKMLQGIEEILILEKPDAVLVYGDTNSTLSGALAASKLHIPIAHVEAGLRSFNRMMPEEINRIVTDHISNVLFTPSESSFNQLRNEGIKESSIFNVGDVMFDASLYYAELAKTKSAILSRLNLDIKNYILCTIHRAENTDILVVLKNIVLAINEIGRFHKIILPLHPRTRKIIDTLPDVQFDSNIMLIDPVGYLDMISLEQNSILIITDSGGVQKEAFFFEVPCVTLREETEWIELIQSGWNIICPPTSGYKNIQQMVLSRIDTKGANIKPYGEGSSSKEIVDILATI